MARSDQTIDIRPLSELNGPAVRIEQLIELEGAGRLVLALTKGLPLYKAGETTYLTQIPIFWGLTIGDPSFGYGEAA